MFYSLARPDRYPRNPRIVRIVADLACCDRPVNVELVLII